MNQETEVKKKRGLSKGDTELIDLLRQGIAQKDIATHFGKDESTISKRIKDLKQAGIIQYPVAIVKLSDKKKLMAGHVTITVRGDPELKQRLEDFFAENSDIPRSAISQMLCEFALFAAKEIKDGGELVLRKDGKERKIRFPAELEWRFLE